MRRKKDPRITVRLVTALIASMVTLSVAAQAPSPRPKLVVGIVIDGLREDYLDLLKGYFGENGFKLLMRDGVMLDNVNYGTALETYSPKSIRVSTLSDEVRIDGGGIGNVYSVAPSPSQSIILAGHAGNSAFWINDVTGRWATTAYYKDVPQPMQARNFSRSLASRLDTLTWKPSLSPESYPDLPAYKKYYPFRHQFLRNDIDRFRNYKTSAPVNTEVTDIAADYIRGLRLGTHDAMDMLNLGYTLAPFAAAKDADNRIETMDSYLKLDADLARLFRAIDTNVGLKNTFIMVAGTPAQPSTKRDDEKWGIPNGEFIPRHAVSLLCA